MNKAIFSTLLASGLLLFPAAGMAQSSEHQAVEGLMQELLRGFEAGSADRVLQSFRSDGVVVGYAPSVKGITSQSAEQWASGFNGVPADDEDRRHRRYTILDVENDAAVVKLQLDYPGWQGTDYLALLKIEGKWMVVSKSWSGKPTP